MAFLLGNLHTSPVMFIHNPMMSCRQAYGEFKASAFYSEISTLIHKQKDWADLHLYLKNSLSISMLLKGLLKLNML